MFKVEIKGVKELERKLNKISQGVEREAKRLNKTTISQDIIADDDGYVDRECPECKYFFKVHENNFSQITEYTCPSCGHKAAADSWYSSEQVELLKKQALEYASGRLKGVFNNKPHRHSFQISNEDGHITVKAPAVVQDILEQKRTCSQCTCAYAVVGAAYFCPSCGDNAIGEYFNQSLTKIESSIEALPAIKKQVKTDQYKLIEQGILENAIEDCATAFQKYSSQLYNAHSPQKILSPNDFQRLDGGNEKWQKLCGKRYSDYLTPTELGALRIYFQQRHLLSHHDGFVDQQYIERSGDNKYQVGQRLVITKEAVLQCIGLIRKLVTGLEK